MQEEEKRFGTISAILREKGNLLEQFLENKSVEILRVYPYESRCGDVIFSQQRKYIEKTKDTTPEDLKVLEVIDMIRTKVEELGWNDNKIVVEAYVGIWHIFIGYWDYVITLGLSVKPHYRYNPKFKADRYGSVEEVKVR